MKLSKIQAIAFGLIWIIIFAIFVVWNGRIVEAQQQEVCCEQTNDGGTCVYTDQSNCKPGTQVSAQSCEQTSFCQTGCCVDTISGGCFESTSKAACGAVNGAVWTSGSCNNVAACQSGCCQLGNSCQFITQQQCNLLQQQYPSLQGQDIWNEQIGDEASCQSICTGAAEGCCVDGNGVCNYGAQSTCITSGQTNPDGSIGFFQNTYCSSSSLQCACQPHATKKCIPERGDEVYWIDGCGNYEGVAESCDFDTGTMCGEASGSAKCESLDCKDTFDWQNNPHDPRMGQLRAHGESWCAYESGVGGYRDRPGSRHYRGYCFAGKEFIEECRNFREEVCVQSNYQKNGKTYQNGQCIFNDVFDIGVPQIVSTVPRGMKFWSGENKEAVPELDPTEVCSNRTTSCTILWVKKNRFDDWDCQENCECEEDNKFITDAAFYCKAAGDCGADVNILNKESKDGLEIRWSGYSHGPKPINVKQLFWDEVKKYGVFGGMLKLSGFLSDAKYNPWNGHWDAKYAEVITYTFTGVLTAAGLTYLAVVSWAGISAAFTAVGFSAAAGVYAGVIAAGAAKLVAGVMALLGETIGGTIAAALCFNPITCIIGALLIVFGLAKLLTKIVQWIIGDAKVKTKTVTVTCKPWQAPAGGEYCDQCRNPSFEKSVVGLDSAPYQICNEYRCKSLGAACEIVNEGTNDVECVWTNKNDVNAPKISPWTEILPKNFTTSLTGNGYYIRPIDSTKTKIPPLTLLSFGIRTDEASRCKWMPSSTPGWDEMTNVFGDFYYRQQHNMTILTAGNMSYAFYLRCEDLNGNQNGADYAIQFETSNEPDLTAPVISWAQPASGSYVMNGKKEEIIQLGMNEPIESCRWSFNELAFGQMSNNQSFKCEDEFMDTLQYQCFGLLTGIEEGKSKSYFIKCRDIAGNINQQSYLWPNGYILSGSLPLQIVQTAPSGNLYFNDIKLYAKTSGGAEGGKAVCSYQDSSFMPGSVKFSQTGGSEHYQNQKLNMGNYNYFVRCNDVAGNEANTTISFQVTSDTDAPVIMQVYFDADKIYMVTNEDSSCEWGKEIFGFGQGKDMETADGKTHSFSADDGVKYFVRCADSFGNINDGRWVSLW